MEVCGLILTHSKHLVESYATLKHTKLECRNVVFTFYCFQLLFQLNSFFEILSLTLISNIDNA